MWDTPIGWVKKIRSHFIFVSVRQILFGEPVETGNKVHQPTPYLTQLWVNALQSCLLLNAKMGCDLVNF